MTQALRRALERETYVTNHFRYDEFACHDGTPVPERYERNLRELCEQLEVIRAVWKRPVTILSGYRSPAWNKKIGGADKSWHMKAGAADIVVAGIPPKVVADIIEMKMSNDEVWNGGLGRYKTFTHVDIGKPRRWTG